MTVVVPQHIVAGDLLGPVTIALRSMRETSSLAPGLLVSDETGWLSATRLADGSQLPELIDSARRRWHASAHAAAALAWKSYSYWLALPAILGWACAKRVPLMRPADVLVRFSDQRPFLTVGLRQSITVAVLPSPPLPESERELLAAMRESLMEAHLMPLLGEIQARVRVSGRTLLGSVSSGIAHGILRASSALEDSPVRYIDTLLRALGIQDLIQLVPGPAGEPTVLRKTCCLAFTLPEPKICTGCCIKPHV